MSAPEVVTLTRVLAKESAEALAPVLVALMEVLVAMEVWASPAKVPARSLFVRIASNISLSLTISVMKPATKVLVELAARTVSTTEEREAVSPGCPLSAPFSSADPRFSPREETVNAKSKTRKLEELVVVLEAQSRSSLEPSRVTASSLSMEVTDP